MSSPRSVSRTLPSASAWVRGGSEGRSGGGVEVGGGVGVACRSIAAMAVSADCRFW